MATVTGITTIKSFLYRGVYEEFSNTYHFKGSPPGNSASWDVLRHDLVAQEQKMYPPEVHFQRVLGYDSNDPHAANVYSFDYAFDPGGPPPGTLTPPTGGRLMAGDQAALIHFLTDAKSTKGKPIILYKFIHHGYISTIDGDAIDQTTYQQALAAAATPIAALHGGLRSAAHDLNVIQTFVSKWVTTRTLKHRGKKGGPGSKASAASSSAVSAQGP